MATVAVLTEFEPLRVGLAQTFTAAGLEVRGRGATLAEFVQCVPDPVDLIITEWRTFGREPEVLRDHAAWLSAQRVVFLGEIPDLSRMSLEALQLLMQLNAVAFVASDGNVSQLIQTAQLVADGTFVCDMEVMKAVFARLSSLADWELDAHDAPTVQLSPREVEVLVLVARGMNNRSIAEQMVVSEGTVKAHVSHILTKLSLQGRSALVRYALTHELPAAQFSDEVASEPHGIHRIFHSHISVRLTETHSALQTDRVASEQSDE